MDRVDDRAIVEVKHFTTTRLRERVLNAPGQNHAFRGS
jgi:hypothetical protein